MMNFLKNNHIKLINLLILTLIIVLPYLLFQGKLYIGGDDTRLFYSYPENYLHGILFYSWYNFSSLGWNTPPQSLIPLVSFLYLLEFIVKSKIVVSYFAFSLPLIIGFLYFQKLLGELIENTKHETYKIITILGSLFYISSPIIMYDQLFIFLTTVWLLALIPILLYYFIRFQKTSNFIFIIKASVWTTFLSLSSMSVPWIAGLLLPLTLSGLVSLIFFSKKTILEFIKKTILFGTFLIVSQAFWFLGFVMTYINLSPNSFSAKVFSSGFSDTFIPTIISTATGSIIFPLLNLFQRQIAFDYDWYLKTIFSSFYEKTFIMDGFYILILALGVMNFRQILSVVNRKRFVIILISFMFSLYFFTVNIGPLKDFFIFLRHIPGFVMFRNVYDKFSVGFVIIYSILLSFCLIVVIEKWKTLKYALYSLFVFVVVLNLLPINKIVNPPVWTTDKTYKNITIPKEYLSFMNAVNKKISPTNNILSLPFGSSIYTVIKDDTSNNVFLGSSPVIVFSGVNDISGRLSFNFTKEADTVNAIIINGDYKAFNNILYLHNINYIFLTKNIPPEVLKSYAFDEEMLKKQDKNFINSIIGKKVLESSKGNYILYETRKQNSLIVSKNVYFQKINNVEYKIYIKGLKNAQSLEFLDSYHPGWELYLNHPDLNFCKNITFNNNSGTTECRVGNKILDLRDLSYLFKKTIFSNFHELAYGYANQWKIDSNFIEHNYKKEYYKINKDGSIDIELTLYFLPQTYFYLGVMISFIAFLFAGIYIFYKISKNENSK